MANKLFIGIDMFTVNQDILLVSETGITTLASVPVESVGNLAYSLIDSNNIEEIEINGNKKYTKKVAHDIINALQRNYSKRNVRITTNGEVFN